MSWDDAIDGVDRDTPGGRMPRGWTVAARLRAANDDITHAAVADTLPAYAELHCLSDFSFLRGASSAEQLFARAHHCGYSALAITDECSLAGIVRGLEASRATGVQLIVGSEFTLVDGTRFVLLVENAHGYPQLCSVITTGRRAAGKGAYRLGRTEVEAHFRDVVPGVFALWLPGDQPQAEQGAWLQRVFAERAFLAVELHREQDDAARLQTLQLLAQQLGMSALASGDVHMAQRRDRIVQDTLTAIRHTLPLADCGAHLFRNGERHLRPRRALGNIYPHALLQASVELAQRCTFDLSKVQYTYPRELVPQGHTPASYLRQLTEAGMRERWPEGAPAQVVAQIDSELELIAYKGYEAFFLTVQDVVRFARAQHILCQGRGSSANSAVCYALGITAVNPSETRLLMARFLSKERDEPPDIDVDFEHERREEVLQYVYTKYGRERAALAATVICYRGKSAVRDVAKAFGLPPDQIVLLANCYGWGNGDTPMEQRIAEAGFDLANPLINKILAVTEHLRDHPRHLSQHVGGFVISDEPLSMLVPVENAAMADRTIIQWDKDDLETMKLLKVDCLALGMLTCIRKTLDLVRGHRGRDYTIATLPHEDAATYKMIQRADTVGVFQIESRAQMAMLPRLKPREFYDLVIEVAIVRPGPIQGDMVHPYLRRRQGYEPVSFPSPGVEEILGRTLGIPLFQEQVMEPGDPCRLYRQRGRPAAAIDGGLAARRRHGAAPRTHPRTDGRARLRAGIHRPDLRADQRLRFVRIPAKPRRLVRQTGVRQLLAQAARTGGLCLRATQCAADGVLFGQPDRAGRAPRQPRAPACGGVAGGCVAQRLGQHPGRRPALAQRCRSRRAAGDPAGIAPGERPVREGGRAHRCRTRAAAICRHRRPVPARGTR